MAAYARLKIEFTEGDKYQTLMSRLNLIIILLSISSVQLLNY